MSESRHPRKMASCYSDADGVVEVVDTDGILVGHCDVVGIGIFSCAE